MSGRGPGELLGRVDLSVVVDVLGPALAEDRYRELEQLQERLVPVALSGPGCLRHGTDRGGEPVPAGAAHVQRVQRAREPAERAWTGHPPESALGAAFRP